jgi:hypothetical protein
VARDDTKHVLVIAENLIVLGVIHCFNDPYKDRIGSNLHYGVEHSVDSVKAVTIEVWQFQVSVCSRQRSRGTDSPAVGRSSNVAIALSISSTSLLSSERFDCLSCFRYLSKSGCPRI